MANAKIDNTKLAHQFADGEEVVDMVIFDGTLLVATNKKIYRLGGRGKDQLVPVDFKVQG
jgi:hypothetical protein